MNNYHYYLKQEIPCARLTSVAWDIEKPRTLYLTEPTQLHRWSFEWETMTSKTSMPKDTGSVAVVDGEQLLMTPFRCQNVPPPMSAYQIRLSGVPRHVAFSPMNEKVAVLYPDAQFQVFDLGTRIPRAGTRGGGKLAEPKQVASGTLTSTTAKGWKQILLDQDDDVVGLPWSRDDCEPDAQDSNLDDQHLDHESSQQFDSDAEYDSDGNFAPAKPRLTVQKRRGDCPEIGRILSLIHI